MLAIAEERDWLSGEHFSVDGTLIQAWAGHKSFVRKDGSGGDGGNFKGTSRSNDTHQSSTDADVRIPMIVTTDSGDRDHPSRPP